MDIFSNKERGFLHMLANASTKDDLILGKDMVMALDIIIQKLDRLRSRGAKANGIDKAYSARKDTLNNVYTVLRYYLLDTGPKTIEDIQKTMGYANKKVTMAMIYKARQQGFCICKVSDTEFKYIPKYDTPGIQNVLESRAAYICKRILEEIPMGITVGDTILASITGCSLNYTRQTLIRRLYNYFYLERTGTKNKFIGIKRLPKGVTV
jgi:hypothetical protein